MPFRKHISPFTVSGRGGGVVQYIKSVNNSDLRHKATAKKKKKNNRLLHIFIFIFSLLYFFASFKEKNDISKLIFPAAFYHLHFVIRILSSAFCHPHFVVRILLSAIRHPPPSGPYFTETHILGNLTSLSLNFGFFNF